MNLQQVLDAMNAVTASSADAENWQVVDWCAALSAHLARMGEPVARIKQTETGQIYIGFYNGKDASDFVGAEFYLASSAPSDWDKVRDVIDELKYSHPSTACQRRSNYAARQLTAALPESRP